VCIGGDTKCRTRVLRRLQALSPAKQSLQASFVSVRRLGCFLVAIFAIAVVVAVAAASTLGRRAERAAASTTRLGRRIGWAGGTRLGIRVVRLSGSLAWARELHCRW
jgi:hypothetical protein